jgi:hypothetical protein
MDYIWRTGFFADSVRDIKEDVRENGPSLLGVGVAAGTGGVVGAYLHGLWHNRNRVDAYSVSPYFDTNNVPKIATMGLKKKVDLMGDGGVCCVSEGAADGLRCTNVYDHIAKTFITQPKQPLGGRLFTKVALDELGSGVTSGNYPKKTTNEHFMAMAKYLGQPIIVFDSTPVGGVLPIRTIYPCVIYKDDTLHLLQGDTKKDGNKVKNSRTPICIAFDSKDQCYMQLELPATDNKATLYKLGVWHPPNA